MVNPLPLPPPVSTLPTPVWATPYQGRLGPGLRPNAPYWPQPHGDWGGPRTTPSSYNYPKRLSPLGHTP